jgi:hypothetical protein
MEKPCITGLEYGEFTGITPEIVEIARKIRNYSLTLNLPVPEKISHYLRHKLPIKADLREPVNLEEVRKRTASQCLKSGYANGCTDTAISFLVLSRVLGHPAIFVDATKKQALEEDNRPWLRGHCFVNLIESDRVIIYEPREGARLKSYTLEGREFVPMAKGIDFGKEWIFNHETKLFYPQPERIQTQTEAEAIAKKYFGFK